MEMSVSSTQRPLYPYGNSPFYPLDARLCRKQRRSERGGEEKSFQSPWRLNSKNGRHRNLEGLVFIHYWMRWFIKL